MCTGIALPLRDLPQQLIVQHQLQGRVTARVQGGDEEIHFLYRHPMPLLPIWHGNQLLICAWGNQDAKRSRLPRTGWARMESLEEGKWSHLSPEPVEIPACFGLEKGVWFQATEGMRGILVHDEGGRPRVYMLTEKASHYYHVMTRHDRMPVLIGERI